LEEAPPGPLDQGHHRPDLKVGNRVPNDVLEHIVGLYEELKRRHAKPAASPEEARRANADLRRQMRERGNYFEHIEKAAAETLRAVNYSAGPLSQGQILAIATHHGFSLKYVQDLPRSARSLTDHINRRIYLKRETSLGMHSPRTILLQTLGHVILGHSRPEDFGDFLRQRVEANYFAAAVL